MSGISTQSTSASRALELFGAYSPIALTAALLALVPLRYSDSRTMMTVIIIGMVFAAYTIAFNIILGSTGQLFLCTGALAGIGGFTSAILTSKHGWPFIPSIVLGTLLASAIGGLLSWVAVRRSLDAIFTGVVTLAFSLSYENLVLGRKDLTGGENGLRVKAAADTILTTRVAPYYVFLGLVVVYLVLYRLIERSHVGWAFRSLRDDEVAAELSGVNVTRYRVYAGLIGSAMLGLAGALFAHNREFIAPTTFAFGAVDVRVLVMLVFGGIGSMLGPVIGAVALTIVDEALVDFAQLRIMLYGIVIVVLFLGFRRGVVPSVATLRERLTHLGRRSTPAAVKPPGSTPRS